MLHSSSAAKSSRLCSPRPKVASPPLGGCLLRVAPRIASSNSSAWAQLRRRGGQSRVGAIGDSSSATGSNRANGTTNVSLIPAGFEATGVLQFLGITGLAAVGSYFAHPYLLQLVSNTFDFTQEVDDDFTSSFFSLVGIVYGLFSGNSFLILFDRQVNIVQELYGEVFALELLVQAQLLAVPDPTFRQAMAKCVRRYVFEEVYNPVDMQSPFESRSAYSDVIKVLVEEKKAGYRLKSSVEAAEKLADSQSRRSSLAAEVLPSVHFTFLNAMIAIFVVCFLVFDTASGAQLVSANAGSDSIAALTAALEPQPLMINEERRLAFAALVGVLVLTQQVLMDLTTPTAGLYSFRSCLDGRLTYLMHLLHEMETQPAGWVPDELQRLHKLGMIGGMTESDEVPSVPDAQHLGGRRTGAADSRGAALRRFDVSTPTAMVADSNGSGSASN